MPTLQQVRAGAYSAVGKAVEKEAQVTGGARDINSIRTNAFAVVQNKKPLAPAFKAPEAIKPISINKQIGRAHV